LDLLPSLVYFNVSSEEQRALEGTLQLLAGELAAPSLGSSAMVDRLADMFFIQSLRAYILADQQRLTGWSGAMADERLGAALRLMHNDCAYPWTVALLAQRVGMSRAVFAARFKERVGISPMSYLTRSRIYVAQRLLQSPGAGIAQVADAVGYESEAAFNKAFKRETGVPPGKYRETVNGDADLGVRASETRS
jgi:transcriptional regulator GlxA family with amidase domain